MASFGWPSQSTDTLDMTAHRTCLFGTKNARNPMSAEMRMTCRAESPSEGVSHFKCPAAPIQRPMLNVEAQALDGKSGSPYERTKLLHNVETLRPRVKDKLGGRGSRLRLQCPCKSLLRHFLATWPFGSYRIHRTIM
eukprot:4301559-Pleurochrysis_carterae.AAC.3